MIPAHRPRRGHGRLLYAAYLALCAELLAKAMLLVPAVRAVLPADQESAWRIRWVNRYLWAGRAIFYHFDAYDPTKGWALRPGRWDFAGRTVTANSRGIRGTAEHAPGPAAPGLRRVVVVGDSFTFGEGVHDHETFPAQLQARLGPSVEVINLGVHGYGHDQMLIHLREEGTRYAPDLVVLGYHAADLERNALSFRDYAKPRFELQGGSLVLAGSPVPPPARVLIREAFRSHVVEMIVLAWRALRPPPPAPRPGEVSLMESIVDEMRRLAESRGARFVIVDLPPVAEIALPGDVGPSEGVIADYALRRGVPLCRTRSELRRRLAGGTVHGVAGHYDSAVQRDVADVLAGCIARDTLLSPPPDAGSAPHAAADHRVPVHEQE